MNRDKILIATAADIFPINNLINGAYRGKSSEQGWANEIGILEGNRMDEAEVQRMIESPNSILLKYITDENVIVGCCNLEIQGNELYLGTLTVSPDVQTKGIGKEMLKYADEYAVINNCTAIVMTVVSGRTELINWYIRHGYRLTGESKPFPTHNRFGNPLKKIELIELKKYF